MIKAELHVRPMLAYPTIDMVRNAQNYMYTADEEFRRFEKADPLLARIIALNMHLSVAIIGSLLN